MCEARYPCVKVSVYEIRLTKYVGQCCHIEGCFFFTYPPSSGLMYTDTRLIFLISSLDVCNHKCYYCKKLICEPVLTVILHQVRTHDLDNDTYQCSVLQCGSSTST